MFNTRTAVTKKEYNEMTPFQQGYVSYMQGAWNSDVPDKCPYLASSSEGKQFQEGQARAVLEVQDSEE